MLGIELMESRFELFALAEVDDVFAVSQTLQVQRRADAEGGERAPKAMQHDRHIFNL